MLKYIPDMTMQLPRILHILFSTFYACQSVLFLYLATSFAKKRAVTKHLTSKFCFVQHFLIKIQLTRFMVKCAKSEEAARSYLECTLTFMKKIEVFSTSKFDQLSFLTPLSQEEVKYLFRKPKAIPIEYKHETG